MEYWSIAISIVSFLVAFASFKWNKAQHNLNQLQLNGKKFCETLQEFIGFGTEHCLSAYKYDIENIYHLSTSEKQNLAFNNLQKEFSSTKDLVQKRYRNLIESISFWDVGGEYQNSNLSRWLSKIINDYYLKLNEFYGNLSDINQMVLLASEGQMSKQNGLFVNAFFDNILSLLEYNQMLIVFKAHVAGYLGKLSLSEVGLFGNTQKALIKIEKEIAKLIEELGFDDVIYKREYSKIRRCCTDFGIEFESFVKAEKDDFVQFLNSVQLMKIHALQQGNKNV